MVVRNKKKTVERTISSANAKINPMTVIRRAETASENQHRFRAATDALLRELVRQQLGREENK